MNMCVPCSRNFCDFMMFVHHMATEHGVDRALLWRRIEQCQGDPVASVRTLAGRWMIYRQSRLDL